jgi:hypothetical protein
VPSDRGRGCKSRQERLPFCNLRDDLPQTRNPFRDEPETAQHLAAGLNETAVEVMGTT